MKRPLIVTALVVIALALLALLVLGSSRVQDTLLARGLEDAFARPVSEPPEGGMRVFMCGTASPLPTPDRAQACVAVQVDDRLFIVDAGAGSADVASLGGLPLERLQGLLLTHFHSDHIAAIGDFNLQSWVAGRPAPLQVIGPEGVDEVVAGFNQVYRLDRGYRVAHHGEALLPPELHVLEPRTISPGVILDRNGLVIRAFEVDHGPVSPALGYRFEYGGRSVAITGDTVVTDALKEAVRGADLLLSDALSLPIVRAMEQAARNAGRDRQATILADIRDYHAATASLAGLAEELDLGQIGLYHLVPAPRGAVMAQVFSRDLPRDILLTDDGTVFDLPPDGDLGMEQL